MCDQIDLELDVKESPELERSVAADLEETKDTSMEQLLGEEENENEPEDSE